MHTLPFPTEAVPPEGFVIDQPDFKAGNWRPTMHDGKPYEISSCYELLGGKWEGFVAMRRRTH